MYKYHKQNMEYRPNFRMCQSEGYGEKIIGTVAN